MNRKHLAKGDGRNKAGKKSWQGDHFHQKEAPKAATCSHTSLEKTLGKEMTLGKVTHGKVITLGKEVGGETGETLGKEVNGQTLGKEMMGWRVRDAWG